MYSSFAWYGTSGVHFAKSHRQDAKDPRNAANAALV